MQCLPRSSSPYQRIFARTYTQPPTTWPNELRLNRPLSVDQIETDGTQKQIWPRTYLCLKCAEEVTQIRMLRAQRQHLTLDQCALHVIILQHDVLLQTFDRVVVLCVSQFRQQNLERGGGEEVHNWTLFSPINRNAPFRNFLCRAQPGNESPPRCISWNGESRSQAPLSVPIAGTVRTCTRCLNILESASIREDQEIAL